MGRQNLSVHFQRACGNEYLFQLSAAVEDVFSDGNKTSRQGDFFERLAETESLGTDDFKALVQTYFLK